MPRRLAKDRLVLIEVDGEKTHPETVDTVAFLELASAFFDGLVKVAAAHQLDLQLHGLKIVDKCASAQAEASDPEIAAICVKRLWKVLSERDGRPEHGLVRATERFAAARLAFPRHRVRLQGPRGKALEVGVEVPTTRRAVAAMARVSLRAVVVSAGGDVPSVVVRPVDGLQRTQIRLQVTQDLARRLAQTLYDEVDVLIDATRDPEGQIIAGQLVSYKTLEPGDAVDALERWFKEHGAHWNDVADVMGALGRGQ